MRVFYSLLELIGTVGTHYPALANVSTNIPQTQNLALNIEICWRPSYGSAETSAPRVLASIRFIDSTYFAGNKCSWDVYCFKTKEQMPYFDI